MKRNYQVFTILLLIALFAVAGFAQQQRRGPGSGTPPAGPQTVLTGNVVSFTAGQGSSLVLTGQSGKQIALNLGPVWFVRAANFSATAGDLIQATVIACAECASGYAVVVVKNVSNGSTLIVRGEDGLPLWQTGAGKGRAFGRGGPGRGPGNCTGDGPDMTQVAAFSGTVVTFSGGPGSGKPALVLNTSSGEKTFLVAPYHAVLDAGLVFTAGASFTITAAPNTAGEWVVIKLKDNATGAELVLRDAETGFPIGGRGRF
jgi:hypothetical protein